MHDRLVHWLDGGDTSLENTAQLCRGHHRFVHEWGFAISKTADGFVFFGPDGAPIRHRVERPAIGAIAVATTSQTNAPGWDGWPIDYALCVARGFATPANRSAH